MSNEAVVKRLDRIETILSRLAADSGLDADLLFRLLYGAVARFGNSVYDQPGTVASIQVPMLEVPPNHSLKWEELPSNHVQMMGVSILTVAEPVEEPGAEVSENTPPSAADISAPVTSTGLIIEDPPPVDEDEALLAGLDAEMKGGITS